MKHLFLLILISTWIYSFAQAQEVLPSPQKSLVIENPNREASSDVFPMNENKFIICEIGPEKEVKIGMYDSAFQKLNQWKIAINTSMEFIAFNEQKRYFYILLANYFTNLKLTQNNLNFQESLFDKFLMIRISKETGVIEKMEGAIKSSFEFRKLVCNDKQFLLVGNIHPKSSENTAYCCLNAACLYIPSLFFGMQPKKIYAMAIHGDFIQQKIKNIPFSYRTNISVLDCDNSLDGSKSYILMNSYSSKGGNSTLIKKEINMQNPASSPPARAIKFTKSQMLSNCHYHILNDNEKLIIGTENNMTNNNFNYVKSISIIFENQDRQIYSREIPLYRLSGFDAEPYSSSYNSRNFRSPFYRGYLGKIMLHQVLDEGDHFLLLCEYYKAIVTTVTTYSQQGGYQSKTYVSGYELKKIGAISIDKKSGEILFDSWTQIDLSTEGFRGKSLSSSFKLVKPYSVKVANPYSISLFYQQDSILTQYILTGSIWTSRKINSGFPNYTLPQNGKNAFLNDIKVYAWYDKYMLVKMDLNDVNEGILRRITKKQGSIIFKMPTTN